MTRFSWVLSTTLAVQKCTALPVVKNRAPTVGTPLNCRAVGIPGGGLTAGPALTGFTAGPAAAICEGVQNARAACCAAGLPARTPATAGFEPPLAAPASPPTAVATPATTSVKVAAVAPRRCRVPQRPTYASLVSRTYWHNRCSLGGRTEPCRRCNRS